VKKGSPIAAVIITAAGSSRRMNIGTKKEFLTLDNQPVLLLSVKAFIDSKLFSNYIVVLSKSEIEEARKILAPINKGGILNFISGGSSRQESVYNGLLALKNEMPDIVLIHDGARPWINRSIINKVYNMANLQDAAIPVVPSINAMKFIDSSGIIVTNLKREFTVAAQTPQGFKYTNILDSHKKAHLDTTNYIDDAAIYSKYSGKVATVPGDVLNKKITYQSDMVGLQQADWTAKQPGKENK
jgi:2-C-methyl-D-erythritol 4-phosphate cytidylyltransferase